MRKAARRAALLAAVLATALGSSCGDDPSPASREEPQQEKWVTYRDAERGYTVEFPRSWYRASESLTPELTDPREILSLGSYRLRARPGRCKHVPSAALEELGPSEILVSIQERGLDPGSPWNDFPRRPERFNSRMGLESADAESCVTGPPKEGEQQKRPPFTARLVNFTDAGRHFQALVAIGDEASRDARQDAFRVLDGLRFDPDTKPDWRASG